MTIENIKGNVLNKKKIAAELDALSAQFREAKTREEKNMISSQIKSLQKVLKDENKNLTQSLKTINVARPLVPIPKEPEQIQEEPPIEQKPVKKSFFKMSSEQSKSLPELERKALKRMRKKEKKVKERKVRKASPYVKMANRFFADFSREQIKKGTFKSVEKSIIRGKLPFIPASYVSIILFTTIISVLVSILIFLFLLFFSVSSTFPLITSVTEGLAARFLKVFWVLFIIPIGTFLVMYVYPSMEEKSAGLKLEQELPFATIHMAAISGSMIDPTQIFNILVSTREYPYLEKEFTRLINQVNIYGYDLITALKNVAYNSPSKKLSDLLNGLATTISSGGDLSEFFEKRADSLLFDYRIEREKYSKSAETFMDIYISVVIAAPMILMLLLIMMRVSGLGISLSASTITIMSVAGVFLINVLFLTFLHLRQPGQ